LFRRAEAFLVELIGDPRRSPTGPAQFAEAGHQWPEIVELLI
jgi:hypothetical protein